MSDSSAIDAALVARLHEDPELAALLPDGVFYDEAPHNSQRFAIVSRVPGSGVDLATFDQRRAVEDYEFLITAVMLTTAGGDIRAAAGRIDALLQDQPLPVDGYAWGATYRLEHVRVTEKDEIDPSIRWLHRGGRYRVQMALVP